MTADTSIFMCRDLDLDTSEYRQEILPCIAENIVKFCYRLLDTPVLHQATREFSSTDGQTFCSQFLSDRQSYI